MKSVKSNIKQNLLLLLFILTHSIFSYNPFYNYTSSIRVNGIAIGEYVWAATNGGLMRINPSTDRVQLRSGTDNFPDLKLTALCFDTLGNLWIGTKKGYLYKITPKDRHSIYTSYYSSEWDINDIYLFGKYLIIGSSKGCSVFDTDENKVLQNAVTFGAFNTSVVYKITVHKDTLYLGCEEGVAKLDISGGKILTSNFLDKNIWILEYTAETVKSFTVYNDSLHYMNVVSGVLYGELCYTYNIENANGTEENYVYKDTSEWLKFSSKVTSMVEDENRLCWFGTEENCLKRWNGKKITTYGVGGLTFRTINKVYVSKNGKVWCIPYVTYKKIDGKYIYPWWQGVAAFNNDEWTIYRPDQPSDFGKLGDGPEFLGIAEGPNGNMWFGLNGQSIKKYNPDKNRWDGYAIGVYGGSTFQFKPRNRNMGWGKCDAIARDSSGYMWFTAWTSDSGSIICYNPDIENPNTSDTSDTIGYRYFFPKGSPYHIEIPRQLNVDVAGNIFLGAEQKDEGRLIVFGYDEGRDPLTDGINNPILDVKLTKIWHMVSTEDTITWVASGQGLYLFKYDKSIGPLLLKAKNVPANITCIEVESSYRYLNAPLNSNDYSEKIETVMWLGTQNEGVARVNMHQMINSNGIIDSIGIDSVSYLKESEGLISNTIKHMDMDRKNGYLWIATDEGLSRYDIGHSFKKIESNVKVSAYPNPFILSRHTRIVFENLASGSSISIYTVDGRLVANIVDREANVIKTGNEWTFIWKPDRDIIPGVYFYIAKREQEHELYKRRGIVGKLLILP